MFSTVVYCRYLLVLSYFVSMEINDDLTSRETDILRNFIMPSTKTLQIGLGATGNSHLRPRFPQTILQFNLSYILQLCVDNMKSRLKFEKFV